MCVSEWERVYVCECKALSAPSLRHKVVQDIEDVLQKGQRNKQQNRAESTRRPCQHGSRTQSGYLKQQSKEEPQTPFNLTSTDGDVEVPGKTPDIPTS